MISNVYTLFLGRMLGGVSATLLYSVFETWFISEAQSEGNADVLVRRTLSSAATLNAAVAIASGAAKEVLVSITGSKRSPFAASIACLMCAASIIMVHWVSRRSTEVARHEFGIELNPPSINDNSPLTGEQDENFGSSGKASSRLSRLSVRDIVPGKIPSSTEELGLISLAGFRVTVVTFTTCAIEGAMYAMVFFWTRSIQMARAALSGEAPYGLVFANFMSAM